MRILPLKRRGGTNLFFRLSFQQPTLPLRGTIPPALPVKATVNTAHSQTNTPLYKAPLLHPPPKSRAEGFPLTESAAVSAGCGVCTVRTDEPILPTSAPVLPSAAREKGGRALSAAVRDQ